MRGVPNLVAMALKPSSLKAVTGKGVFHLLDNPSSLVGANKKSLLDAATGPFDVLPDLGSFRNVFDLPYGGTIDGNTVVNELLSKLSWTSAYENNKVQVKVEQGFKAMTGVEPSYIIWLTLTMCRSSTPLKSPLMRAYWVVSSLYHIEGMLAMAQAMTGSMQKTITGLRSKKESLKSFYSMLYVGYNNLFGDLTRAKELEVNLSKKFTSLEQGKVGLRRDLEWVMRKAIPRMLAKVLCSEQFDNEMLKVQKVLINHGRDLGRQEARDLLMSNQRIMTFDPDLPRKAKDVVRGLKKIKWECMKTVLSSPVLYPNLLHGVLERGDSFAGNGRAADVLSKDLSSKLSDFDVCLCYLVAKFSM
ncbi:hypothetical protein Tco_0927850 [Tanacetum coccineum]